ncbi:nuclear transport factor 2 family protein [Haloechinothrix halophila]|uniref:nuclear transport factor 2 family protein n=1 Tax=Haloechinothrix halophila TaxID=1069073 RepID=UPI00041C8C6D|nr:nuclear transport factor 2 family protein [Haloechinothrix halophila]
MDLVALEEIRGLKYRYARTLDLKRWDEFAEVFTEDATANYGTKATSEPLTLEGRDAIVSYMRDALGGNIITVHFCAQPEIEINGDTAAGTWCFEDTVIVPDHRVMIKGSAYYEDSYRRENGVWRISHIGYVRTYELMVSFDDMPSLQLLANRWSEDVPQPQA